MKQITLNYCKHPDKSSVLIRDKFYRLYLGNDVTIAFRDKKKFDHALTQVNRKLNIILTNLITVNCDVIRTYYDTWPYLGSEICKACEIKIKFVSDLINRIVDYCSGANGSVFVFRNLYLVIEYLNDILLVLLELRRTKQHKSETMKIIMYRQTLQGVRDNLDCVGK